MYHTSTQPGTFPHPDALYSTLSSLTRSSLTQPSLPSLPQVHEKSILLPLLPVTLLAGFEPTLVMAMSGLGLVSWRLVQAMLLRDCVAVWRIGMRPV